MAGGSTSRAAQSAPHSSARSLSGQHRSVYAAESLRVLPGRAAAGTATQHATGAAAAAHHAQHTPRPTAPPSRPPPPRGTSVELSHVVEHGAPDSAPDFVDLYCDILTILFYTPAHSRCS